MDTRGQSKGGARIAESVALVVMESGSPWGFRVSEPNDGCVTLVRAKDESASGFRARVSRRLSQIEQSSLVTRAIFCCSDDTSPETLNTRLVVARVLLVSVARTRRGGLELVARADAPPKARRALLSLVGTLSGTLSGTPASVRFTGCGPDAAVDPLLALPRPLPAHLTTTAPTYRRALMRTA